MIGAAQAIDPQAALGLYGGAPMPADLVVLRPGVVVGEDDDPVALTLIGGNIVYRRGESA